MILVNGNVLMTEDFPNGEKKVRVPWMDSDSVDVTFKYETDQDLMNLLFLKDFMDDYGFKDSQLEILYLPYSRMDREIKGDLFTLRTICKFINRMNFGQVLVHEPHSDVGPALLDKCRVINTTMALFTDFSRTTHIDFVFYPDAGAQKRYHTGRYPVLVGNKVRNAQTGRIESYDVPGVERFGLIDEKPPTIVILDDLSSYGGTFLHAAKALKALNAGDIYLIVAHAENAILKGEIFSSGLFKKVITTNSIIDYSVSKVQAGLEITELY